MNYRPRNHRLERLIDRAPRDGARIGILSTWDVENNRWVPTFWTFEEHA